MSSQSSGYSNVGSPTQGVAQSALPSVGTSPYAYNQVAPLTAQQQQAMQGVSNLAQPTSDYLQGAMNTGNWMQSGALMNPASNHYLSGMYNAAAQPMISNYEQAVAPNILQQGATTGTLGSAGYAQNFANAQNQLSSGLGDLAANLYGNAYNTGLSATQNAMGMAPTLANAQYIPTNQLFSSGQLGQQQAQNVLNTATSNLNQQANWPFQAMGMLQSALQGLGGQSGTTVAKTPSTSAGK